MWKCTCSAKSIIFSFKHVFVMNKLIIVLYAILFPKYPNLKVCFAIAYAKLSRYMLHIQITLNQIKYGHILIKRC